MLPFDDTRWNNLKGGYRVLYDPRPALARLALGDDDAAVWNELWGDLHHQGDVGEASYAAVPHIVDIYARRRTADWNMYALVGTIEIERHESRNPPIPDFISESYSIAWKHIPELALDDLRLSTNTTMIQAAGGALLLARGLRTSGQLLLSFTEDELEEMVAQYRDAG